MYNSQILLNNNCYQMFSNSNESSQLADSSVEADLSAIDMIELSELLTRLLQSQMTDNKLDCSELNNKPKRSPENLTGKNVERDITMESRIKSATKQDRYKTELCRPYEENRFCRYGDKCQFAHGVDELRSVMRHPKYKTEMCRTFHTTGFCPYGPRCHFIHSEASTVSPPANVPSPTRCDKQQLEALLNVVNTPPPLNLSSSPEMTSPQDYMINRSPAKQMVGPLKRDSLGSSPTSSMTGSPTPSPPSLYLEDCFSSRALSTVAPPRDQMTQPAEMMTSQYSVRPTQHSWPLNGNSKTSRCLFQPSAEVNNNDIGLLPDDIFMSEFIPVNNSFVHFR